MEPHHYNNLLVFLDTQQCLSDFNQKQQQQLKKAAKYFINKNGTLYYQDEINSTNLQ
jgi:hypothetical protein